MNSSNICTFWCMRSFVFYVAAAGVIFRTPSRDAENKTKKETISQIEWILEWQGDTAHGVGYLSTSNNREISTNQIFINKEFI